jgi:hypothetical protein
MMQVPEEQGLFAWRFGPSEAERAAINAERQRHLPAEQRAGDPSARGAVRSRLTAERESAVARFQARAEGHE